MRDNIPFAHGPVAELHFLMRSSPIVAMKPQCSHPSWKGKAEVGGRCHAAELAVNGEVIMCAGSVHTPQIMQLSGIGPADQLREMGIDVKADLPGVGQNMMVSPSLPDVLPACGIASVGFHEPGDVL